MIIDVAVELIRDCLISCGVMLSLPNLTDHSQYELLQIFHQQCAVSGVLFVGQTTLSFYHKQNITPSQPLRFNLLETEKELKCFYLVVRFDNQSSLPAHSR